MDLAFQLATVCRPISKIKCSQKVSTFSFNLLIYSTSGKIGHSDVTTNIATATNCMSLYDLIEVSTE